MFPILKKFISFVIERRFSFIVVRNFGRLSWVFSAAVKMFFESNGPLIEALCLLFSISRLVLRIYEPRNLLDRGRKAYKILSEIWKVQFYFLHDAWIWCCLKDSEAFLSSHHGWLTETKWFLLCLLLNFVLNAVHSDV